MYLWYWITRSYNNMSMTLKADDSIPQKDLLRQFVSLQYKRNDIDFRRGTFRVRGDTIDLWPSHSEDYAWRISMWGDDIEELAEFDPLTGKIQGKVPLMKLYANSHYVTPGPTIRSAISGIEKELQVRIKELREAGHLLEAQTYRAAHFL